MKTLKLIFLSTCIALGACAKGEVESPCPNFGKRCSKQPINSWNYYQEMHNEK